MPEVSADDVMIVNAARCLSNDLACFVGIGLPSTAANLARRLHAPDCVLIYESGCIGSKPTRLPVPRDAEGGGPRPPTPPRQIFPRLQAGRIERFLGAASRRFGNINSTVIGDYAHPTTRLPGAGGAPEIAASAGEVIVIIRQNPRSFVERCDFVTSVGFGRHAGDRQRLGLRGSGPQIVITDLGILRPDPVTCELVLTDLHPGRTAEQAREATGWPLAVAEEIAVTAPPTDEELATLATLKAA